MKKGNVFKKIIIVVLVLLIIMSGAFFIYVGDFYEASDYVEDLITENSYMIQSDGNYTVVRPQVESKQKVGIIFYPGGKVESTAYMPLLIQLSKVGFTSVLVDMPMNLAVFNVGAAGDVYAMYPEIESWYLAGHSLGGAMASSYMEENFDKVKGLILLGAYPINEAPVETLAIYGTHDIKLDLEKVALSDEVYEIVDGNHAYFGDYGEQEGDGKALISREEQQALAVERIKTFILKKK